MRKFRSILTLVLALVMSVSMVACAEEAVLPSADVEEQGYDFYDGAVEYNEIRDSLGAVPAIRSRLISQRIVRAEREKNEYEEGRRIEEYQLFAARDFLTGYRLPPRCSRMRATT